MFAWKDENKLKRGRGWPIFLKKERNREVFEKLPRFVDEIAMKLIQLIVYVQSAYRCQQKQSDRLNMTEWNENGEIFIANFFLTL